MFTNLIESDSHRKEFKRRSSFFFATVAAYALILSAAGIASIYAYDAHLEAQRTELMVDLWVPPIKPTTPTVRPRVPIAQCAPRRLPCSKLRYSEGDESSIGRCNREAIRPSEP